MGNCPISLPEGHSGRATVPSGSRIGPCSPRTDDYDISTNEGKQKFLTVHKADKPSKCILDPMEVNRVLNSQATELDRQRRREQATREGISDSPSFMEDQFTDVTMNYTTARSMATSWAVSAAAKSYATTNTDMTRKITNMDRYASKTKKKFRNRHRLNKSTDTSASSISRGMSLRAEEDDASSMRDIVMESRVGGSAQPGDINSVVDAARKRFQSRHNADDNEAEARNIRESGNPETSKNPCLLPVGALCSKSGASSTAVLEDDPPSEVSELHRNVLLLRLKSHVVDFFVNQYLPMFPDTDAPLSMFSTSSFVRESESPFSTPDLVRTNSGSSVSSHSADANALQFGNINCSSVYLAVDGSSFLDLAVSGSLGLVNRAKKEKQLSKDGRITPNPDGDVKKNPHHYLVLMNRRSAIPLAVCALRSPLGPPVVRIYATKPRVRGQESAASTSALGLSGPDLPLFAWAELVTEGEFPFPVRYSIFMATGSEGYFEQQPRYRASHVTPGSPNILVVGRNESEKTIKYSGCCSITVNASDEEEGGHHFDLSISRGIDPALFICLAAVVDETTEHSMRLQYDVKMKKIQRLQNEQWSGGSLLTLSKSQSIERKSCLGHSSSMY